MLRTITLGRTRLDVLAPTRGQEAVAEAEEDQPDHR